MFEGLMIKDIGELSAIGILFLVIVVLLVFGWRAFKRQADSLEKLAKAIEDSSKSDSAQNTKLDSLISDLRRLDDKFERIKDFCFNFNLERRDLSERN